LSTVYNLPQTTDMHLYRLCPQLLTETTLNIPVNRPCNICSYHMVYNVLSAIIIWFTMYYLLLSYGLQCTICYYHMVYNVLYALIIWFTMYYLLLSYGLQCTICSYHMVYNVLYAILY